ILEDTRVTGIEPHRLTTERGVILAPVVLRCVEGFTPTLPGLRRVLLPVYSLMIATEPLPDRVWDEIGLHARETFTDGRHLLVYGQRTADGRMAFGGRGAPYHYGSTVRPEWDMDSRTHELVKEVLWGFFPHLGDTRITRRLGGAVAVPRDWRVSVDYDPLTRLA